MKSHKCPFIFTLLFYKPALCDIELNNNSSRIKPSSHYFYILKRIILMAKGDIKTCKGKRRAHSHGNARLTTEGKRKHHSA